MVYNKYTEEFEFSDGKKIRVEYFGFVGIGSNLVPKDTYSDLIEFYESNYEDGEYTGFSYTSLSPEHKKELAQYMISLWKKYGDL